MINLDEHIAQHIDGAFVPEGNVCWIATANKDGEPDIGPITFQDARSSLSAFLQRDWRG